MAVEPRTLITPREYLALEHVADQRHEYIAGERRAMDGGSPQHSQIATNTISALSSQLRQRPCTVYGGDLRVAIRAVNVYTYPDVTVVCGEPQFDGDGDGLLNPTLIVEVQAPATAVYDAARKFQHYRQLPSLREYVLIAEDAPLIARFAQRADGQWLWSGTESLDESIALLSIDCTLALADVYAKIVFEPSPSQGL